MDINNVLISLLRAKVLGREIDKKKLAELTADELSELYKLSASHEVANIVGAALIESGALDTKEREREIFSTARMLAVFRVRRLTDELNQVSALFEREGIEHIVLKGSVLRNYYPEPWMRTSCDIDILVKKEKVELAKGLLIDSLEYTYLSKTGHDMALDSPTGVHLELHFALIEDTILRQSHPILFSVWERAVLCERKKYTYAMPDEMFYFYHIVHTAKHFLAGGCGIRAVLDLWILETFVQHNKEKREKLLAEADFLDFEAGISKLSRIWFGDDGEAHDEFTLLMEKNIFLGGMYGTVQNGVHFDVVKAKSKARYLFVRIFPPYKTMQNIYPSLEKCKFLLPIYHVRRWFRLVFGGGTRKARARISELKNLDKEEINESSKLLNCLGLDRAE